MTTCERVSLPVCVCVPQPRMRHVLSRRFGLDGEAPQTLEDLGTDLGITRERVRQIETRALRQLRSLAPGLQAYLTS